jgi:large subunit ribosomal protein LP2
MRYVAAYLLAVLAGNASPDLKTVEKILSSVGIETDNEKANKVISELQGKSVEELIAQGSTKLASMPSGGAAPAASAAAPAAAAAPEASESFFFLNEICF